MSINSLSAEASKPWLLSAPGHASSSFGLAYCWWSKGRGAHFPQPGSITFPHDCQWARIRCVACRFSIRVGTCFWRSSIIMSINSKWVRGPWPKCKQQTWVAKCCEDSWASPITDQYCVDRSSACDRGRYGSVLFILFVLLKAVSTRLTISMRWNISLQRTWHHLEEWDVNCLVESSVLLWSLSSCP